MSTQLPTVKQNGITVTHMFMDPVECHLPPAMRRMIPVPLPLTPQFIESGKKVRLNALYPFVAAHGVEHGPDVYGNYVGETNCDDEDLKDPELDKPNILKGDRPVFYEYPVSNYYHLAVFLYGKRRNGEMRYSHIVPKLTGTNPEDYHDVWEGMNYVENMLIETDKGIREAQLLEDSARDAAVKKQMERYREAVALVSKKFDMNHNCQFDNDSSGFHFLTKEWIHDLFRAGHVTKGLYEELMGLLYPKPDDQTDLEGCKKGCYYNPETEYYEFSEDEEPIVLPILRIGKRSKKRSRSASRN